MFDKLFQVICYRYLKRYVWRKSITHPAFLTIPLFHSTPPKAFKTISTLTKSSSANPSLATITKLSLQ